MRPPPEAVIGQGAGAIDTPALVIDLDAMDRNIARLAAFARQHGVRWRPHAKTHKSAEIGRLQMAAGAAGVCVQKTGEAEALADGGVTDILISNEVVAPAKLARVAALADRLNAAGGRLGIVVDSLDGVAALALAFAGRQSAIDVFVELDVGQGRCGVWPGEPALELARAVVAERALTFAGLQAYNGKAQHQRAAQTRREAVAAVVADVLRTRAVLEAAGIAVPLVTGAGTGTFPFEAASGVFGELQAGSFVFMDVDYARNEPEAGQPVFENALFVKTQVMSRREAHAVCDAGLKSHATDSGLPRVWGRTEAELACTLANDEHTVLRGSALPALGDTLWLVPGHCDPTVNLHDHAVGVRGGLAGGTVERVIRIDARGAST